MDDPFTFTFTGRERIPKYVKHVIISEDLDCVPCWSFAWNSTIESVVGHAGIRTIEKCAFYECTSLSYVNFPGVVEIEEHAFVHCKKLPFVRFPNLEVIGQYAFDGCDGIEFIDLPSVRFVEDSGFQDCTKLVGAIFGSRLENLQRMVFRGCFSLEYVSLPLKAGVIKCDECSGVLNDGGYTERYQRWLKNVDIFNKKMVLFPVHLAHHWSLVVVLNPRFIRQTKAKWGVKEYTKDVTALIHLDPLGNGTVHDKSHLGRAVRDILNKEWDRRYNNALDQFERPFNHRHDACRLRSPTVPTQTNGYDCGVHVCRYVTNLVSLINNELRVKMSDIMDNFSNIITEDKVFDFTEGDIDQMRTDMYNVMAHVRNCYRNHRDEQQVFDLLSDSDDDDEDELQLLDDNENDDSGSDDECLNDADQFSNSDSMCIDDGNFVSDDELSVDTTGDLKNIRVSSDDKYNFIDLDVRYDKNGKQEQDQEESNNLNQFVQMGDIIEYRKSKHDPPSKAEIVSIGEPTSDKIIKLSDGTWLMRRVHQVKRLEIVRPLEDVRLVNPSPKWKSLDKLVIIPPYETVEDDVDTDCKSVSSNGSNEFEFDEFAASQEEKLPKHIKRSEKDKRERTSCGETGRSFYSKKKRAKSDQSYLDRRRETEKYIPWANSGNDYTKIRDVINDLYKQSLSYGIVDKFYEFKLYEAPSFNEYRKRLGSLRSYVNYRKRNGHKKLNITTNVLFMDNPAFGERGRSRETYRARQTIEEILKFEYKMRTLDLQTCSVCRENTLEFTEKDKDVCARCKKAKHDESNYYLDNNLHPIWYERDEDGFIKIGEDGEQVVRYDVPSELQDLSMAEKLLIRRCSPFIPSMHIKDGIFGINGHCVCFPQDIDSMCNELPQTQSNMVIFIRHMSDHHSNVGKSKHYRVNKEKVLRALHWLKRHHRGYHNITITESNLDWIKNGSICDVAEKHTLKTKPSRRDAVAASNETISSNQCDTGLDDNDDIEIQTVHPNYKQDIPNNRNAEIIKNFMNIAEETNQKDKVLNFPPIDHTNPLNEFDSTEQVFVNSFPWLYPGGVGDVYDSKRGKVRDIHQWAKHMLRYQDGRFINDQMFCLYVFNMLQRHTNNSQGNFFYKNKHFLGASEGLPPTVEELQQQIQTGDLTYLYKLRYLAKQIRGSDSYWRGKTEELEAWIDFHISRGHGPPTHFITLSCAENWWPDLRRLMIELERKAGNKTQAELLEKGDFKAMAKSVKRFTLFVNDFFMKRSRVFLDTVVKNAMGIEHYWARVEFAPGRGQIHLHLLGIGKDKSYLYDFYRAKTEEEKAKVMEAYATNVLDMTADIAVDEKHEPDRTADSANPLRIRYCECINREEDARLLCQECMVHKCNNYCLGDNMKHDPRVCRFGNGQEVNYGVGDTPGKPHCNTSVIVTDKRGIEHFQLRRTKSRKAVQHSRTMLQCWRGNVDIQLLIYRSHPDKPDVTEIEKVCQYVVAYASKKNHTSKHEKEAIQNIVQSKSDSDINGVQALVKMSLNWMTSKRLISIQEAVHEVDGLSLTLSSEYITYVSVLSCLKLRKSSEEKPRCLIYSYATRDEKYNKLTLDEYFYKVWCKKDFMKDPDSGRVVNRILLPKGLNCRPRYPIDYDYARGMLYLHKPWSFKNPLCTRNKQKTIDTFKRMLDNRVVPTNVLTEYHRAVKYAHEKRLEVVAKKGTIQADVNIDDLDEDDADQYLMWLHSSQLTDTKVNPTLGENTNVDIGFGHTWSDLFFKGERDVTSCGTEYTSNLRDNRAKMLNDDNAPTIIPTKSNGSKYDIKDLSDEQQMIVLATVDTVVKFLMNREDYKPLRATVTGMGGCGKSHIINTIITIIREMTDSNDTVQVAAPSGSAAYNVGGCTLHSLLGINVQMPWKSLTDVKKKELKKKLKELLVLMVDERSMLNCHVTFGAEEHVRECAFNGHNFRERWGGVPVVLFFGDDYQLPPTDKNGAINGFDKYHNNKRPQTLTARSKNNQICESEGSEILTNMMTIDAFELTKNFRTKDEDDCELMNRMRVGDQTKEDAQRLMNLHISDYSPEFRDQLEGDPKTLHVFSKRDEMNKQNVKMLVETQKRLKVPIARLRCQFKSNMLGNSTVYTSHFYGQKLQYLFDVCVGANVCLETVNIDATAGLFVGAIGNVVDIVYDEHHSVGPNTDGVESLPKYIVVDFPSYKPPPGIEPWDRKNPTHVPIPPCTHTCNKRCCTASFMPLQLAYAITLHRCQGMEAGFDEDDRWNRMVMDPSDGLWERSQCLGTAYVATSRAKTLGSKDKLYPTDSALYWTGPSVSEDRLKNCKTNQDGKLCISFKKRDKWVKYLKEKVEKTKKRYTKRKLEDISGDTYKIATSGTFIKDRTELTNMITETILRPNKKWKETKQEYMMPPNYFS